MGTYRVPVLEDFSWQPPVLDKDLYDAPGAPEKGDRYIVASGTTSGDDWYGLENHIVTYDGGAWLDDVPEKGWYCFVEDENILYHYTGSVWDADDISGFEADVVSIDIRVSNVESSVGSIDSEVDTNITDISNVESSVASIDTEVDSIDTDVGNVESSVDSIDTNLTNTDSSVGSIDTEVDSINTDVGNVESSVGSIDTKLTNTDSSVGSINTVVASKQDKGTYVSEYGAIEFEI